MRRDAPLLSRSVAVGYLLYALRTKAGFLGFHHVRDGTWAGATAQSAQARTVRSGLEPRFDRPTENLDRVPTEPLATESRQSDKLSTDRARQSPTELRPHIDRYHACTLSGCVKPSIDRSTDRQTDRPTDQQTDRLRPQKTDRLTVTFSFSRAGDRSGGLAGGTSHSSRRQLTWPPGWPPLLRPRP